MIYVVIVSAVVFALCHIIAKMIDNIGEVRRQSGAPRELELRARNAVKIAERFGETETVGYGYAIIFSHKNGSISK